MSTAASAAAADKLGTVSLKLVQLRYKYEDGPAPAGCEAQQQTAIKTLALLEDGVLLTLSTVLDTKNVATYSDYVQKTYLPRMKGLTAGAAGAAAPAATMAATAAASICPDAAFTQKVGADFTGLGSMGATETDPAVIGAVGLKILNLRYAYEDMTAPAGCEGARQVIASVFLLATDQVTLTLAKLGDKANAATYDAFIKKDLNDRGQKAFGSLSSYLDLNAMMLATAAPTAAK